MSPKLDLSQFVRPDTPPKDADIHTRSVAITRDHQEYLERTRINLSALVRAVLDAAMLADSKSGEKSNGKG